MFVTERSSSLEWLGCAAVLFCWLLSGRIAFAQSCVVNGPRYNLNAETVHWSMRVASGRSCVRGIRFGNVEIESVKLVSPPQTGRVVVQRPGFTYTAKADYVGQDSFSLMVSGTASKMRGSSTIQVAVSVVGPPGLAPRPVDRPPVPMLPQAPGHPAINNDTPLPVGSPLPPCPIWDWSNGAPPPMRPPFDRSKLYCPPPPFKPPNPPVGCVCPEP